MLVEGDEVLNRKLELGRLEQVLRRTADVPDLHNTVLTRTQYVVRIGGCTWSVDKLDFPDVVLVSILDGEGGFAFEEVPVLYHPLV